MRQRPRERSKRENISLSLAIERLVQPVFYPEKQSNRGHSLEHRKFLITYAGQWTCPQIGGELSLDRKVKIALT